jgi:glucan biosynthesis protein C
LPIAFVSRGFEQGYFLTLATRLHGLDAARASMMLLGVFVHAALVLPVLMPTDPASAAAFGGFYAIIHTFRMPVFFVISGYFAARLLNTEGARAFIISRFKRIVSVLVVASAIIAAFIWNTGCTWCAPSSARDYLNTGLIYLWFLYYLALISHLALLAHVISRSVPKGMLALATRLAEAVRLGPITTAVFAGLLSLVPNLIDGSGQVRIEMGWVPNLALVTFFSAFFALGWLIWRRREVLLRDVEKFAWVNLGVGLASGAASTWLFAAGELALQPQVQILAVTFATFAVLGLFLRYLNAETQLVRYLADASYWVYLFHAPVMFVVIALGAKSGWSPWVVAVMAILASLVVTLVTYHYLVRSTIIGKWLSGRRRSKSSRQAAAATKQSTAAVIQATK